MTPEETAAAVWLPVAEFGAKWMFDPATHARVAERGYDFGTLYAGGRGGVLGEVDADEVARQLTIFDHDQIRTNWERARSIKPTGEWVAEYADELVAAGRADLPDDEHSRRLAELTARVVDAADASDKPLFAGWRAVEPPADHAGAAAFQITLIREFRGCAHYNALAAHGIDGLTAVLIRTGPDFAAMLGHGAPYPEIDDDMRDRWTAAEVDTAAAHAAALEVLTADERTEYAALIGELL